LNDEPTLIFVKSASLDDPSAIERRNPITDPEDSYSRPVPANCASSLNDKLVERKIRLKVS
jgi:hypothetical protein